MYSEALQAASKTGEEQLIFRIKVSRARLSIAQKKFPAALRELRGLSEQMDSVGLRYISTACLLLQGEALIGMKDYDAAEKDLKTAILRSQKQGLLVLQAQSHFELAKALQLSGKAPEASTQEQEVQRLAASILKEAQADTVRRRADLAPLFETKAS
jgi:tetratricopeptide (TPR) repeat protein